MRRSNRWYSDIEEATRAAERMAERRHGISRVYRDPQGYTAVSSEVPQEYLPRGSRMVRMVSPSYLRRRNPRIPDPQVQNFWEWGEKQRRVGISVPLHFDKKGNAYTLERYWVQYKEERKKMKRRNPVKVKTRRKKGESWIGIDVFDSSGRRFTPFGVWPRSDWRGRYYESDGGGTFRTLTAAKQSAAKWAQQEGINPPWRGTLSGMGTRIRFRHRGKVMSGKIVMPSSQPGSWVVNIGGRYGTPMVVSEDQIISRTKKKNSKKRTARNPKRRKNPRKWMKKAVKRPGALRRKLSGKRRKGHPYGMGLKKGKKISPRMLSKAYKIAKKRGDTRTMRQINFARVAKKVSKKRRKKRKVVRGVRFKSKRRKAANPRRRRAS